MQNLKIHSSTSAQARFLIGYIDFDVLMIQELAVQRINCLVNRLFGDEVESSAVRNGSNRCALSWRGDLFDKSGGRASAGSISIPMPVRFLRVLTAATATPESWAREPNMPFSQIGMPADDLVKAACLWPSRSMRVRATIRAAPLALRTWTALRQTRRLAPAAGACSYQPILCLLCASVRRGFAQVSVATHHHT